LFKREGNSHRRVWMNLPELRISRNGADLVPVDTYRGLKTYALTEKLQAEYGQKAAIICIGLGGERKYPAASVSLTDNLGDPSRNAARGGLGAVMGAKGVKAVVIDASGAPALKMADPERFKASVKSWIHTLEHDVGCGLLSRFGTPFAVVNSSYTGSMPADNYTTGKPDGFKSVSAETIQYRVFERGGKMHGCMPGCVVKCSILYPDENGNRLAGAYEYEAVAMLGTNLGINDPDAVARMKFICDDLGIDVIEIGAALAMAGAKNRMTFGDEASAINLLKEIEDGTEFGNILAGGVVKTAGFLGIDRVPAFKGQAIPGHDPRGVKGTGMTYATSPMGADHTAGLTYRKARSKSGQKENSLRFQIEAAVCDTFGYCINAVPGGNASLYEFLAELSNARFGTAVSSRDIMDIGKETLKDQLEYNQRTEFHTRNPAVPAFVRKEPLIQSNQVFDVDESEINSIWDGLAGYSEPGKAWEVRIPKMAPLLMGVGVFRNLGKAATQFKVDKFLVVSDPFMKKTGRTQEVRDLLSAAGMDSAEFAEIEPDPPVALIERAGTVYQQERCSGIVAIGGGSSLDAGKAIALRVSHTGNLAEFESIMGGTAKIKDLLPPVITIPTTSGTGSDVNPYAVVTDTERGVKFAVRANRKYCEEQYRDMAWALDRTEDLEQALLKLYRDLNMATRLADLGIPGSAFRRIAFAASREVANIASNPAPMDEKKLLDIME